MWLCYTSFNVHFSLYVFLLMTLFAMYFIFVLNYGKMEKEMATHSSILAWKSPWTEEPGGLQSMGLHDWACVHEGGGWWVGRNKPVELKKKNLMDGCHWTLDGPVLFLPLQHLITLIPITTPWFSSKEPHLSHSQSTWNARSGLIAWAKGWTCEQVLCMSWLTAHTQAHKSCWWNYRSIVRQLTPHW